ncbi:MAG: AAA family ATPase, partial [Deltaproteobacteria bacterium]|nr:AAA family ATPase [Deltaproteobacteria bacterium]
MLKKDLILRNPLRLMGYETEDILPEGGFGAVLARAGVGKTSFIVQLALNSLLRSKNVLHISLNDPVEKVCLWYEEVFRNIADQYKIDQIDRLWETILPLRLIMTFKVDGFSVPKLKERLADITEQNIFSPHMILIDGFPFEEDAKQALTELKSMALQNKQHIWFTVRTHRYENADQKEVPARIKP